MLIQSELWYSQTPRNCIGCSVAEDTEDDFDVCDNSSRLYVLWWADKQFVVRICLVRAHIAIGFVAQLSKADLLRVHEFMMVLHTSGYIWHDLQ
jgi:hypothetical protein